jgi:ABC-type lipoprotein export system ATPase subunit
VIVVTHDERMIAGFDRVYHMIDGRITNHGSEVEGNG